MNDKEKRNRINELKSLIEQKKKERDYNKAMQLALKLVINGTYGAFANKYFVCSNADIANSITAHGRDVNQFMMEEIENYFYNEWHLDTDIHKLLGMEYIGIKDGKYASYSKNFKMLGWGHSTLESLLKNKNLPIEKLKKVDFKKDDIDIIYEFNIFKVNEVNPLDNNPTWAEEEGRQKYMGNNQIVVYGDTDSLYITYLPIMKSLGFDLYNDVDFGKHFILHIDQVFVKGLMNKMLDKYANQFSVNSLHDFELETISKSALFLKKKHYLNNIVWEDGVHYDSLSYYYPKGIEIIRSSTPPFVRKNIYRVINYIFGDPEKININDILKIVKGLRKEFEMADIEDISMTTSCSNYNQKVLDDTVTLETVKGAHFGVKAAAFHNYLLNKNSEYKTKYDFVKSGRIKYYYCKHPTADVFGYLRSFHPIEIVEKEKVIIDMDTQFEKSFLGIINKFIDPLGLPKINK
ncbi:MAG: DNA polymerase domain-containing protein, partial [bacterium]